MMQLSNLLHMSEIDKSLNLEQLTGEVWPAPQFDSHLVLTCNSLRKIPLRDFTIEDYRIMIGQSFDLEVLLPLAVDVLKSNPLAEGDYYPGDLLSSVLTITPEYWVQHQQQSQQVFSILTGSFSFPILLKESVDMFLAQNDFPDEAKISYTSNSS
jgi:hypothetical protein